MANGMSNIAHVVVLMLENRSFDNLLGWLYGPGNPPANVIGGKSGDPPFFGLTPGSFWHPSNASLLFGKCWRTSRPARTRCGLPPNDTRFFRAKIVR